MPNVYIEGRDIFGMRQNGYAILANGAFIWDT